MSKLIIITLLSSAMLFLSQCSQREYETFKEPVYQSVLDAPPDKMGGVVEREYRLRPDRRFEMAIHELRAIYSLDNQELEFFFKDGVWHIFSDRMKICSLDEFPSFRQMLDVLTDLAKRYNNKYPLGLGKMENEPAIGEFTNKPADFFPVSLSKFLKELDQRWLANDRHPVYLKWGAEALVLLGLQAFDYFQVTDQVHARALALLAIGKALTSQDMSRSEVMLSYQMGYEDHCHRLLKKDAQSDVFGLFFMRKDKELVARATAENDPLGRYLWLLRFSEKKNVEEWERLQDTFFGTNGNSLLPVAKTGLAMNRFNLNRTLSRSLPVIVLGNLMLEIDDPSFTKQVQESENTTFPLATQLFERGVSALSMKNDGLFSSPRALAAFYRGFYYSGLYKLGIHLLDELSSVQAGMFYLEELGESESLWLVELKQWYSLLLKFRQERTDARVLLDRLAMPGLLRGNLVQRFGQEAGSMLPRNSPKLSEVIRLMVKKMDTRIEHRTVLARAARQYLLDLNLFERILSSSKDSDCMLALWSAVYSHDKDGLLRILRHRFPSLSLKVRVIHELAGFADMNPLFVQYEFSKLMEKDPDNWEVVREYAFYLKNSAKFKQATEVISTWLEHHDSSRGFDYINARKELARLYYLDEKYSEGLDAIEEVATSWQAGVLETKALLLAKIGKQTEAEDLARQVVQRYPSSIRSRAVMAQICWAQGKFDVACDVLKSYPLGYSSTDWDEHIAYSFMQAFASQPFNKTVEAFRMLVKANFSPAFLQAIPNKLYRAGKSRWAFNLQTDLKTTGVTYLYYLLKAYRFSREFKDEGDSLQWLKDNTPEYLQAPLSMVAFGMQEYELPWIWDRQIKGNQRIVYDWLMKAASALMNGGEKHPHWKDVVEYYSGDGVSHYHQVGRYLAGLAPETELYKSMDLPGKKCEISFFLGLKKEAAGDLRGASRWYRVCLETGMEKNIEYIWAYEHLGNWTRKNLFLNLIQYASNASSSLAPG